MLFISGSVARRFSGKREGILVKSACHRLSNSAFDIPSFPLCPSPNLRVGYREEGATPGKLAKKFRFR
jgi:hypothetical protein